MKSERALNLDALRGFAILSMVLAGTIPYTGLPAWMYHAQLPPPDRTFNPNLPGLTWVDLVFPLFLFCLGAAIPLALNRRLNEQPLSKVLIHILERTALLAFSLFFCFMYGLILLTRNFQPEPGYLLCLVLPLCFYCSLNGRNSGH